MIEIQNCLPDSQAEEIAVKCLSQRHNSIARVRLKRDYINHNHGALTTPPRCRLVLFIRSLAIKFLF